MKHPKFLLRFSDFVSRKTGARHSVVFGVRMGVGEMEHWSIGEMERWGIGAMGHWGVGALGRWSSITATYEEGVI